MEYFTTLMSVITAILAAYSFIIFIRIMLSWIPIPQLDKVKEFLSRLVDPYLNMFRGISWLRWGMFDLSPVVGLILLSILTNITGSLANAEAVTAVSIFILILQHVWNFLSFIINALIILLIVRLVVSLVNGGTAHSWGNLDSIIYNMMARIVGFFTQKSVSFHIGLLITIAFLLVCRIGLAFLLNLLVKLLITI